MNNIFDWYKANASQEKGTERVVDELSTFPDGELFFILSDKYRYNYFWMKHKGRVLPVTISYNRLNGFHYMTLDRV